MINPDLYEWTLLNSNMGYARDGVMAAYFDGVGHRSWGGWTSGVTTFNTQYSSADANTWSLESDAPWTGRHTCAYCKVGNTVYMVNGDLFNLGNDGFLARSSYSFDGTTWTEITSNNGLSGYSLGNLLELNGDFYFIGGQNGLTPDTFRGEVWKSTNNCLSFTKIGDTPFQEGNLNGQCFVLNNKLWKISGGKYDNGFALRTFPRKIYSSTDGINWTLEGYMPYEMRGRQYSQIVNFAGGAWMIGGNEPRTPNNLDEVWVTDNGVDWVQQTTPFTTGRHACTAWLGNDGIYMGWGSSGPSSATLQPDIWKMTLI